MTTATEAVTTASTFTRLRRWLAQRRLSLAYGLTGVGGLAASPAAGDGAPYGWVASLFCGALGAMYLYSAVLIAKAGR